MFAMDADHDTQVGDSHPDSCRPPVTINMPPGLKAKPVVPPVQPFNMFASQQVGLLEERGKTVTHKSDETM